MYNPPGSWVQPSFLMCTTLLFPMYIPFVSYVQTLLIAAYMTKNNTYILDFSLPFPSKWINMCVDIWVPPPRRSKNSGSGAPTNRIPGPPLFLMLPPPPPPSPQHKDDAPYFLNVTYMYSPLYTTNTAMKIPFMYSFSWIARGLSPNFHIHVSVSDLYIPRIGPHTVFSCSRI